MKNRNECERTLDVFLEEMTEGCRKKAEKIGLRSATKRAGMLCQIRISDILGAGKCYLAQQGYTVL